MVNFAVVGLGFGASRLDLFEAVPEANLVAVVDESADQAQDIGARYGVHWYSTVEEALRREQVDVVCVYTPTGMHREVALAAARAGKHLLMTKPLEISLERIDEILAVAEEAGVEVFAELYYRYAPGHYRMNDAVTTGLIGRPILGEFSFKCFRPQWYFEMDGGWRGRRALNGGGIMMNQAINLVDLCYWHLGQVAEVQARVGTFAHDIEVEDTAAVVLQMRSGALATLTGTTTYRTENRFYERYGGGAVTRVEINGPDGSLSVVDHELREVSLPGGVPIPDPPRPANVLVDVVGALSDPAYWSPTLVRGREARRSVEIVAALYESAATGAWVSIEPHDEQLPGPPPHHYGTARGLSGASLA